MSRSEPYFEPYAPYTSGPHGLLPGRLRVLQAESQRLLSQRWNAFYQAHETHFFKDRHWLEAEWVELCQAPGGTVLDVGCGVGNALFPLLQVNPRLRFEAFDIAPHAVQLVRENAAFDAARVNAFVCDVSRQAIPVADASADFAIVIFVLSAMTPEQFPRIVRELARCLKPGGLLLIRDYAVGDVAQARFEDKADANKLGDKLYIRRSDGTTSYFFDCDTVRGLFADEQLGLSVEVCEVVERHVENRKLEQTMRRLFLQAAVRKRRQLFDSAAPNGPRSGV